MKPFLIGATVDPYSGYAADLYREDGRFYWRQEQGDHFRESVTHDTEQEARDAIECREVVWHPWEEVQHVAR